VASMLSFSLSRHLRMAREQISERKRNRGAQAMQTYFRSKYDCVRYRKQLVEMKKALKMVWISYRRWNERKKLNNWLDQKVMETRKRKEEERIRMEAARKKEMEENARRLEEERLREQARKEAEERMEKERQKLLEEEREREQSRKEEEKKRAEEEERKKMEHEKEQELARQRLLTASTNLNKQREEGERDKVAIARAKRESSIRMNKGMLEEEERDIKQRREDKFLRDNFPEAINEDDECSSEDGRKTRHKKSKHRPISQNNENDNKEKQVNTEPGEEEDEDSSLETDEAMDEEGIQEQLKNFAQTATVGHSFLKHTPRKRRKQDRIVKVTFGEDNSPKQISWGSGTRHMDFDDILYIAWGHWTPLFQTKKKSTQSQAVFQYCFDFRDH